MKLNDDLVLYRVVLDEPFQCIQAAEADRGLVGCRGARPLLAYSSVMCRLIA
jgi:hypothetical protein